MHCMGLHKKCRTLSVHCILTKKCFRFYINNVVLSLNLLNKFNNSNEINQNLCQCFVSYDTSLGRFKIVAYCISLTQFYHVACQEWKLCCFLASRLLLGPGRCEVKGTRQQVFQPDHNQPSCDHLLTDKFGVDLYCLSDGKRN